MGTKQTRLQLISMTRKPITLVCQETSETGKPLQSENREAMHSKLVTETRCIMEHNGTPFYIDLYDGRVQPGSKFMKHCILSS